MKTENVIISIILTVGLLVSAALVVAGGTDSGRSSGTMTAEPSTVLTPATPSKMLRI